MVRFLTDFDSTGEERELRVVRQRDPLQLEKQSSLLWQRLSAPQLGTRLPEFTSCVYPLLPDRTIYTEATQYREVRNQNGDTVSESQVKGGAQSQNYKGPVTDTQFSKVRLGYGQSQRELKN